LNFKTFKLKDMRFLKKACLGVICILASSSLIAQDTYKPIDFSLQLKSNHLWRGLEVSDDVTLAADIRVKDKSNTVAFGLWGGSAITGDFKEFDYYFTFSKAGFTFALWDIYNFSPGASYNNHQAFNYKAHETGHFIDASVAYRFQGSFPLNISWATVIFGRDRGIHNEKNLYSTYVSMDYPVLRGKIVDLDLGIAGAFALSPEKGADGKKLHSHFYGKSAGIVNVNAVVSKVVKLGSYNLPVSVMALWNPEGNYTHMQVALNLINF